MYKKLCGAKVQFLSLSRMDSPKELFEKIKEAVRPICDTDEMVEEIATNIYLTAMGVRPATIPFEGESEFEMLERFKRRKSVKKDLEALDTLKVFVGPYYDVGDAIVVVNASRYESFVRPRFEKLEAIAKEHPERRGTVPEVHRLIGEFLGYVCPSDPSQWFKKDVDDISYMIDGKSYMGVWCKASKTVRDKANRLLTKMNRALAKIGKKAELVIQKKSGGRRTVTRKKRAGVA